MDYNKINKIDTDGNGNIVLQDISGSTISINYNDIETLKTVLQSFSDNQTYELKQLIGNQNKELLAEIRKIQDKLDEQNTKQNVDKLVGDISEFFKDIFIFKIESAKNRILKNYKILRETEELLILEDMPRRKAMFEKEIETIKGNISIDETELRNIAKQ